MIKKITFLILTLCLSSNFVHAQKCGSDLYLEEFKKIDPKLDSKIKSIIEEFNKGNNDNRNPSNLNNIRIPVIFNIIHNGESIGVGRNLSDAKIQEQIDILNQSYNGTNGGVNTTITFCLAAKDVWNAETSGVYRYYDFQNSFEMMKPISCANNDPELNLSADSILKNGHRQVGQFPSNLYLNVWTADIKSCGTNNLLGYSSFPFSIGDNTVDNIEDGVVVDYEFIGTNSTNSSSGKTLVHEVGHWLGLFHTFQGGCSESSCSTEGDMICDTPATGGTDDPYTEYDPDECKGKDCDDNLTDHVQNYMDYADDDCMTKFTNGQKTRMKDILLFYRLALYNQGSSTSVTACGDNDPGTGSSTCFNSPSSLESYGIQAFPGSIVDANDNWLVTNDVTNDKLYIYKKTGCNYALHQIINTPFGLTTFHYQLRLDARFYRNDILLNKDEIIISSHIDDSVKIFKYDEVNNQWLLNQSIYNTTSNTKVGSGIKIIDKFLFILEHNNNSSINNTIRIYRKEFNGTYTFHQNLTSTSINFPSLSKCIVSKNIVDESINISTPYFTGTYNPTEIILTEYHNENSVNKVAVLGLNSSYNWVIKSLSTLPTYINGIHDFELSNRYAYISSQDYGTNSTGVVINVFKLFDNNTYLPIDYSDYSTYDLFNNSIGNSGELAKTGDFNIVGEDRYLVYNDEYWHSEGTKMLTIAINQSNEDDLPALINLTDNSGDEIEMCSSFKKINGNSMYSKQGTTIRIYNLKDALEHVGINTAYIESTFNENICSVPDNYSTFSNEINMGGNCEVSFNYENKEFVAKESITLKKGASINAGSNIILRINNEIDNCDWSSRFATDDIKTETFENKNYSKDIDLSNQIKVYPNPAETELNISIEKIKLSSIELFDIYGNRIQVFKKLNTFNHRLDVNRLSRGYYVLKVILEDGAIQIKNVVLK